MTDPCFLQAHWHIVGPHMDGDSIRFSGSGCQRHAGSLTKPNQYRPRRIGHIVLRRPVIVLFHDMSLVHVLAFVLKTRLFHFMHQVCYVQNEVDAVVLLSLPGSPAAGVVLRFSVRSAQPVGLVMLRHYLDGVAQRQETLVCFWTAAQTQFSLGRSRAIEHIGHLTYSCWQRSNCSHPVRASFT